MPAVNTDYSNLLLDIVSNDDLEAIKKQVEREVIAWTADYHAAGKREAMLLLLKRRDSSCRFESTRSASTTAS